LTQREINEDALKDKYHISSLTVAKINGTLHMFRAAARVACERHRFQSRTPTDNTPTEQYQCFLFTR